MPSKAKIIQFVAYAASSVFGVMLAFWLTTSLIVKSQSQNNYDPNENQNLQNLVPPPPPTPPIPPSAPQEGVEPEVPPPPNPEVTADSPPQNLVPMVSPPENNNNANTNVQAQNKNLIGDDIETLMAPYNYDIENRRDPFKQFRLDLGSELSDEGVFVGPLRPLQRFDLDKIIPVAIIWDVETPKAMFVDPTNEVHIIGKDERIGRNNGYVAAIREGEVVVIETMKRRGQLSFKTSILKIGTSKEKK
ncbi:MAG: pilus assembly protein PilP [Bdellovibrionales bacterium]|nr:pilus assembly protein PilP [Bdellovibrionales bacterium]